MCKHISNYDGHSMSDFPSGIKSGGPEWVERAQRSGWSLRAEQEQDRSQVPALVTGTLWRFGFCVRGAHGPAEERTGA